MGYSPQETKVQRTFDKAMDQINNLQKVFRDEGMMAKAVVDIGGNQDFGAIQEAFDNLYGALEDAHYDAMAHIEVENTKQELGMNKEPVAEIKTGDDVKETDMPQQVKLAGDSIWDRDESNPNPDMVTVTNVHKFKDDEGYIEVTVDHDGPWTIYTDSGFEKAISDIVGMEVTFSEQGMQDDGRAHLEGADDVPTTEAHKKDCGCDSCADKETKMDVNDELQLLLKRAGMMR